MNSRAREETPAVDRSGRGDRPTRRNVFGPAAGHSPAEAADRNPSGVSGAIPGFVTLQPSTRGLRGSPRFLHAYLTIGAINGFGVHALQQIPCEVPAVLPLQLRPPPVLAGHHAPAGSGPTQA